jgi:membrane protease YdiL (CAAX protease family)
MPLAAPALPQKAAQRWAAAALSVAVLALLPARWTTLLLLAPVTEEVLFRAGLQDALSRHLGARIRAAELAANAATALAFAAAHLLIDAGLLAGLTLLPALLIGRVYQQGRRLAPCIALHALFNAIWLMSAGAFA